MKYLFSRLYLVLFTLIVSQVISAQTIYKWIDEKGRIQYTQQAPDQKEAKINDKTDALSASGAFLIDDRMANHTNKSYLPNKTANKPSEKTEKKSNTENKTQPSEEQKQFLCKQANENIKVLEQYFDGKYTEINVEKDGKEIKLTDEEIKERHKKTVEEKELYCV